MKQVISCISSVVEAQIKSYYVFACSSYRSCVEKTGCIKKDYERNRKRGDNNVSFDKTFPVYKCPEKGKCRKKNNVFIPTALPADQKAYYDQKNTDDQ